MSISTGKKVAIGAGIVSLIYVTAVTTNYFVKRKIAFERACNLVYNKGIVNIGCGYHINSSAAAICEHPLVSANVDIVDSGAPNFVYANLEDGSLPFNDDQFDVALASHILEHLDNWAGLLDECSRVAENVIVVLPNPMSVSGRYFAPEHKQHFSFRDMEDIKNNWPKVDILT